MSSPDRADEPLERRPSGDLGRRPFGRGELAVVGEIGQGAEGCVEQKLIGIARLVVLAKEARGR